METVLNKNNNNRVYQKTNFVFIYTIIKTIRIIFNYLKNFIMRNLILKFVL